MLDSMTDQQPEPASTYYQVLISAEQTPQAARILDALMARRLVLGGPIVGGPAKFLWDFRGSAVPETLRAPGLLTVEQDYRLIVTYSREDLLDELVTVAEEASLEEVCMISCLPTRVNAALKRLLDNTFDDHGEPDTPGAVNATVASTFVAEEDISLRTNRSHRPGSNDQPERQEEQP